MDGQNFNNGQENEFDQSNPYAQQDANQNNFQNNGYQGSANTYEKVTPPSGGSKALAIVSLVMGILSIVLGCCYGVGAIFGIAGLICAIIFMKRGKSGLAIAGLVCSIIGIIWSVYMLFGYIQLFTNPEYQGMLEDIMRQSMIQQMQ